MPSDPRTPKKPYSSPSLVALDPSAAKAKLDAQRNPRDAVALKMLSLIDGELRKLRLHSKSLRRSKREEKGQTP